LRWFSDATASKNDSRSSGGIGLQQAVDERERVDVQDAARLAPPSASYIGPEWLKSSNQPVRSTA
jgi:hypothetical protein